MMMDKNAVTNLEIANLAALLSNYPCWFVPKNKRCTAFQVPVHEV
jgi:hypothetical protein